MWTGTILGIDPSLTGTGLARIQIHGHHTDLGADAISVTTAVFGTDPHHCGPGCEGQDHRPLRMTDLRHRRILRWITAAVDGPHRPDLVCIEEAFLMQKMGAGAQIERIGLYWRIIERLLARKIPVVTIPPSKIKKAITDNGAANKTVVAQHLDTIYRNVPLRIASPDGLPRRRTDDEYDALGAATIGAVEVAHRQLPIRVTEHMLTVRAGMVWPAAISRATQEIS